MKKYTHTIYILIVGGLLSILAIDFLGIAWGTQEMYISCQQEDIVYDYFGPYCLRVHRHSQLFSSDYTILVSRYDDSNYGYLFAYPISTYPSAEDISTIKTTWEDSGITLSLPHSVDISIAKEKFIGGR